MILIRSVPQFKYEEVPYRQAYFRIHISKLNDPTPKIKLLSQNFPENYFYQPQHFKPFAFLDG